MTPYEDSAAKARPVVYTRLQTRLGLVLGLLIVVLSVGLAIGLGEAAERRVVRLSSTNLDVLTQQVARELSSGMNEFAKEVVTQTYRDRFRDPDATADQMRGALEDFQRENPEFSHVSIIDAATGTMTAATHRIYEGGDVRGRPVYEEGVKDLYLGDVHPAVKLAALMPRPANGEPLRFLDVAAPIRDPSGRVFRVFATHIGFEWTAQVRENVLGPVEQRQGVEIFLIDTASKVVLTGSPAIAVGTDFSSLGLVAGQHPAKRDWTDGEPYLTAVADTRPRGSFQGFGWKVVARQPYAVTLSAVRGLQLGFLIGGMLIGLLAAGLAWWLTGRLVRPLRRLADQAERVDAGAAWAHSMPALVDVADVGEVVAVKRAMARLAKSARASEEVSSTQARQFETLASSLAQVVFQADAHGQLDYVNHNWIRAHKPDQPFFIDDLRTLLQTDDREAFSTAWQQALATAGDMIHKARLRAPGSDSPRWFEIQARAVVGADGQPQRWVGTLIDIDELTTLAEATRRALEEEQAGRREADRSAQIRDEFLATVSHELRSPLNAITGWSEILAKKRTDDPMIAKASQSIRRNARHQAGLIDDLMDMTSVMAGKMIIQPAVVDLSVCAKNVFLTYLHSAQEKGVELVCRETPSVIVEGEARRLEQVLSNLVGNSIKFTEAGGRVEMTVGAESGRAMLQVRDSGRGIGADFLPHVFERMRQEDGSVTRRVGGLGLGLAIARGLVELHEGTIEAASPGAGQGAVFTVWLPLAVPGDIEEDPSPGQDPDDAATNETELQGLRVLLVDDEPDAREVAHVALAGFGASVRAASSAAEGLEILQHERFDVLVSDIGMPAMDGLTFIRRLRSQNKTESHSLPAVALTAFAMETDIRAGLEAGFQAYVAKPISLQKLRQAIVTALAH